MEVVLLKAIKGLGKPGDVRNVADGYARNYLIPNGMAAPATTGVVREAKESLTAQAKRAAREHGLAQEMADQLNGVTLTFKARTGESGRLYGSITAGDIAEELERVAGKSIDKRKIVLEESIREVGHFRVPIRFGGDVSAELRITVEPE